MSWVAVNRSATDLSHRRPSVDRRDRRRTNPAGRYDQTTRLQHRNHPRFAADRIAADRIAQNPIAPISIGRRRSQTAATGQIPFGLDCLQVALMNSIPIQVGPKIGLLGLTNRLVRTTATTRPELVAGSDRSVFGFASMNLPTTTVTNPGCPAGADLAGIGPGVAARIDRIAHRQIEIFRRRTPRRTVAYRISDCRIGRSMAAAHRRPPFWIGLPNRIVDWMGRTFRWPTTIGRFVERRFANRIVGLAVDYFRLIRLAVGNPNRFPLVNCLADSFVDRSWHLALTGCLAGCLAGFVDRVAGDSGNS